MLDGVLRTLHDGVAVLCPGEVFDWVPRGMMYRAVATLPGRLRMFGSVFTRGLLWRTHDDRLEFTPHVDITGAGVVRPVRKPRTVKLSVKQLVEVNVAEDALVSSAVWERPQVLASAGLFGWVSAHIGLEVGPRVLPTRPVTEAPGILRLHEPAGPAQYYVSLLGGIQYSPCGIRWTTLTLPSAEVPPGFYGCTGLVVRVLPDGRLVTSTTLADLDESQHWWLPGDLPLSDWAQAVRWYRERSRIETAACYYGSRLLTFTTANCMAIRGCRLGVAMPGLPSDGHADAVFRGLVIADGNGRLAGSLCLGGFVASQRDAAYSMIVSLYGQSTFLQPLRFGPPPPLPPEGSPLVSASRQRRVVLSKRPEVS